MQSLHQDIELTIRKAFECLSLTADYGKITTSNRPDLCDFQCNGALAAAKSAKQNPRALAEQLVAQINLSFAEITIAGPGFLNIKVNDAYLASKANEMIADNRLGVTTVNKTKNVIIDYGGPNIAKPMHVGHLRSSIIGESIKRILHHMGDKVTGDIHMGDWGTQMGMLICAIQEEQPELPYFDPNHTGSYPQTSPVTMSDLQRLYPEFSARAKADDALAEAARTATFELQQGKPGYRALWQHFVDLSIADMKQQFDILDIEFEQWFGESRYQDKLESLVTDLITQKIAIKSDGAYIIPVQQADDKAEIPPLMLCKSDGGFLYSTTDLATLDERIKDYQANLVLYVVDARQSLHFTQVFRAAKKAGLNANCEHLGFGTMNGPDGKPFKTRAGGVMRLSDLITELRYEATKRVVEAGLGKNLSPDELQSIAEKVAIATLKFADLQHDRTQSYQFDLDKFMRFEGKTGPYILYAGVRIRSIIRKAQANHISTGPIVCQEPQERELLLKLLQINEIYWRAYTNRMPNILCEYMYEISQLFSKFYQACHVLNESEKIKAQSRLSICNLTLNVLEQTSDLVGIQIPERM